MLPGIRAGVLGMKQKIPMKNTYRIGNKVLAFVLISALMLTAAG